MSNRLCVFVSPYFFLILGTTKPYPADIVVQFKDIYTMMGQNVTLECFALGK